MSSSSSKKNVSLLGLSPMAPDDVEMVPYNSVRHPANRDEARVVEAFHKHELVIALTTEKARLGMTAQAIAHKHASDVFAPTVQLHGFRDGAMQCWSAAVYRTILPTRQSPKSLGAPRADAGDGRLHCPALADLPGPAAVHTGLEGQPPSVEVLEAEQGVDVKAGDRILFDQGKPEDDEPRGGLHACDVVAPGLLRMLFGGPDQGSLDLRLVKAGDVHQDVEPAERRHAVVDRLPARSGSRDVHRREPSAGHVGEHSESAWSRAPVVLLAHVREVHVPNLVTVVEGDEQPPVAHRDIAWHFCKVCRLSPRCG